MKHLYPKIKEILDINASKSCNMSKAGNQQPADVPQCLNVAYHRSHIADHILQITYCRSHIANHILQITYYILHHHLLISNYIYSISDCIQFRKNCMTTGS